MSNGFLALKNIAMPFLHGKIYDDLMFYGVKS